MWGNVDNRQGRRKGQRRQPTKPNAPLPSLIAYVPPPVSALATTSDSVETLTEMICYSTKARNPTFPAVYPETQNSDVLVIIEVYAAHCQVCTWQLGVNENENA